MEGGVAGVGGSGSWSGVRARYGMGGVEVRDFETVNADSISSAVDVEREVFVRSTDDGKYGPSYGGRKRSTNRVVAHEDVCTCR